jgi:GntP family gluconate:H+ symporter
MTFSHVNDSYFWVVSKFGDLNTSNALKAHSLATLLQGVVAFCVILLGFLLLG